MRVDLMIYYLPPKIHSTIPLNWQLIILRGRGREERGGGNISSLLHHVPPSPTHLTSIFYSLFSNTEDYCIFITKNVCIFAYFPCVPIYLVPSIPFLPSFQPTPLPSHPFPILEYDCLKHFNTLQGIKKIIFLNECTNIFPPHYISCYNRQILIWHYKQNFSLSKKKNVSGYGQTPVERGAIFNFIHKWAWIWIGFALLRLLWQSF